MRKMRRIGVSFLVVFTGILLMARAPVGHAADQESEVKHLEDMVVKEKGGAPGIEQSPSQTVIEIDKFTTIGPPSSIIDVLKTQAIVDFRGATDLEPGVDSIYLRGFDATRFVTAIDALTVQKTGGRKSSNIVDYSLLPTFLIDKIEILPGPHSALYDSKSIGGVLNMVSKAPERRDSLKPEAKLTTSIGSYDTQNHTVTVQGAVDAVTYDFAYRNYATDGYLRNSETNIDTYYGRMGFLLPADGFVTLSASYSDVEREAAVNNPGKDGDYDSKYPETEGSMFDPWQQPTWDGKSGAYRLAFEQASPIGRLHIGAYYSRENRDRAYYASAGDTVLSSMDTTWWQQGGKIQDEIQWTDNHTTTIGFDLAKLYDDGIDDTKTERIRKNGGYLQHQWGIIPSVDLKLGVRYEDVKIWVSNYTTSGYHIPGREKYIDRNWNQLIPKSFTTWEMDGLAPWLRDTSLSVGVSKIWRAPDYHGDYNPQGRPAGAWLDPEHGIGYDLVLNRRLCRDIAFKINYAYYEIKDYIATNSSYANFTPRGSVTYGALNYSDYKINLEEVHRHGVDLELGGHLTDDLSFYLTYAWQKFYNQGDEPAGETELDQRAEHRVSAGLRYSLFEKTTLMLDYYYQSHETTEVSEEIAEDVWDFRQVEIDHYNVVDIGIRQTLFKQDGWFKDATVSLYIKNLFDEEYYDTSGFPATDRTYGISFSIKI
jgi:outer membrane receptor protein involved in Fe transport